MKRAGFIFFVAVLFILTALSVFASNDYITLYDNGYRGEGMVIAVIDSEFDVNHEMFVLSDDTEPKLTESDIQAIIDDGLHCTRIIKNKELNPYISSKIPFAFDYAEGKVDTYSDTIDVHGTHVAGIIGANNIDGLENGFDGIAPEAQLILMKISYSDGSLSEEAIISAYGDAITLGADVINCSFGEDSGYIYGDINTFASMEYWFTESIYNSYIDLSASAGNSSRIGTDSIYHEIYGIKNPLAENPDYGTSGSPSIYPHNISVANAERVIEYEIAVSEDEKIIFGLGYKSFYDMFVGKEIEYVIIPNLGEKSDYKKINVKDKIALVERGIITFDDKIKFAHESGAAGIIIYNNVSGAIDFTPMITYTDIPCLIITQEDSKLLIDSEDYKITVLECDKSKETVKINPSSSWGATGMLTLKPDITAFGTNIYSTFPDNNYSMLTGTSMSAPYVSGAIALIKQHMKLNGIESDDESLVRKYLMTAAEPIINPDNGVEYSPRVQGSGMINLDNVFDLDLLLWNEDSGETKIEIGEIDSDTIDIKFMAKNLTDTEIVCKVDASVLTDGYFYHSESKKYFTADYSDLLKRTVINVHGNPNGFIKIPAGETIEIAVTLELNANEIRRYQHAFKNGMFIEGFVYLKSVENGQKFSLPFMGFYGDWSNIPVIIDGFYKSLPYMVTPVLGLNWYDDSVYANDIGLYLTRDTIIIKVEIFDSDDKMIETLFSDEHESLYFSKMVTASSKDKFYNSIYWDGADVNNFKYIYPDGEYKMVVTYAIPYKPEVEKVLEIPFIIDTVAPELINYEITDNLLTLEIYDDNYLHVVIYGEEMIYTNIVNETTVDIDITSFLETDCDSMYIYIIDVAGNVKVEKILF